MTLVSLGAEDSFMPERLPINCIAPVPFAPILSRMPRPGAVQPFYKVDGEHGLQRGIQIPVPFEDRYQLGDLPNAIVVSSSVHSLRTWIDAPARRRTGAIQRPSGGSNPQTTRRVLSRYDPVSLDK